MSHDFSHNPIKLRVVDLKTGTYKYSLIFVGNVPVDIQRELTLVEKTYKTKGVIPNSTKLRKFYGSSWKNVLGIQNLTMHKHGEGESLRNPYTKNNEDSDHSLDELITSIPYESDDENISQANESTTTSDTNTVVGKGEGQEFNISVSTMDDIGIADVLQKANISISDVDLDGIEETTNEEDPITIVQHDIFENRESTAKLDKTGTIQFIFNINTYPADNILEFKYKIYLATGIPIYRQHLWFKHKGRAYPASYNLTIYKHEESIDIERLISFYTGEKKYDEIEGIPAVVDYYNKKDYIQVNAQDTFNLLFSYYYKYGTSEYFVVDLNDLISADTLYSKISKDRYQFEVIYYGFILIYFPMITITVFGDYLKNEKGLVELYPELLPDKSTLRKRYEFEDSITYEAYEAYNEKSNGVRKKLYSSITETIISINNYKQDLEILLILRNIFDMLVLNDTITYCKANILHENRNIILRKSYMNEREPRDPIPINSLLIKIKTHPDTNENMRLIFFKNGNYIVRTEWREENHMDFEKIVKTVASKINPIIETVNKMRNQVKYYDVDIPILTNKNTIFTETGLVFYYDDDITDARFQIFKKVLEDFRKAGIIVSKETVNIVQEYFFSKGMYKFDSARIEKTIALDNYYDYLSNGVVRQKWNTIFERTRLFQVLNVSSKLKLIINGIRNDVEMEFFDLYLHGMLSIYEKNTRNIKTSFDETVNTKSKKALKNLKLQDPLLYDFKKIYKSNVIYSKICQKPYQPLLLNDDEYHQLSQEKRERAVKYWNFTKQKPVWYSCPNPKFPYIKFITKQHPKDYCIPCCKKVAMHENVNIKKQEIHNTCLKNHRYTGEKVNLTKSIHYVATYGKDIEVGRLSRLPEHTLEPLFFDTYSPGGIDQECVTADGYYIFGVDQNTESIKNVGYLYCLVHALNTTVDAFLKECSARIKKNPDKFRVILDGNIGLYFNDVTELSETILLLNERTILKNKYENVPWNNLFMTIGYYYFGVNTMLFDDQQKELIEFILPKGLKNTDEMFPDSHKNLIILRKRNKYYPIYLLNIELFKRTGIIDTRLFLNESGLMAIIRSVVRKHFEQVEYEKIKTKINLAILKDFIKSTKNISIVGYFVNYANLCYGVYIEYRNKKIYIPIHASHYPLEKGIELIFEPYNSKYECSFADLDVVADLYNRWVRVQSEAEGMGNVNIYPLIKIEYWLMHHNQIIGFVCNNTYYYCKKMSSKEAVKYVDARIQRILYDPLEVNKLIFDVKNGRRYVEKTKNVEAKLQKSMYNYYLYQLILLQFIAFFNKQRNHALRRKLSIILAKTNFEKNMDNLKEFINAIEDIEDAVKLKNIIGRFIVEHHNRKQMIDDIDTTYFNFDRIELERLKKLEYKHVLSELHKIANGFVKIGDINDEFKFPNILTPCENLDKVDYCAGTKLIIKKDRLDEILNVLASDIINPTKWKWLFNSIFIEKSVDFFKFIRRRNENITVEFV